MRGEQEQAKYEQWRVPNKVVYIRELAEEVTDEMLGWTFEQIGPVIDRNLCRESWLRLGGL